MKKLTVDEIIGGLIEAYEKLLVLATASDSDYEPADYHNMLGQVTALRWVLGQYKCSLDGTFNEEMIDTDELENDLDQTSAFILATEEED